MSSEREPECIRCGERAPPKGLSTGFSEHGPRRCRDGLGCSGRWLRAQFEYEDCEECGGGAGRHMAIVLMGNWFARCLPSPSGVGGLASE